MRGDGSVEDVDGDCPPQDGRVVGDDDDDDLPLWEGSSPGGIAPPKGKSAHAQVPPRDGGASSRKLSYDFFLDEILHMAKDGYQRAARGPTRQGGVPRG